MAVGSLFINIEKIPLWAEIYPRRNFVEKTQSRG